MAKIDKKERYKHYIWRIVGLAFIINGVNGIIRTFCLNQSASIHGVIHACITYTAPIAYIACITVIGIGLFIFFMEEVIRYWAGSTK
jgi:hypothetical protein